METTPITNNTSSRPRTLNSDSPDRGHHKQQGILSSLLTAAACVLASHMGHGLAITYALESEVLYDSEIRARDEGLADTSFRVRGTIHSAWRLGPGNIEARLGGDLRRFDKEQQFDQDALIVGIDLSPATAFRNSRLTLSGNASYDSTTRSDPYLGNFIQSEQFEGGARLEYDPNSRVTLSVAPSFLRQFPDADAYRDQTVRSLRLEGRLAMGRERDLLLSIEARDSEIARNTNRDTESLTIQAGWRHGQGSAVGWGLSAGLQSWKRHGGDRTENPFLAGRVHWRINETTRLSAQVDHGLQVYLDNTVNEESRLSATLSRDFNPRWKGTLSAIWAKDRLERITDGNRDDDVLTATVQIEKTINRRSAANLSVEMSDRSSTESIFSYDRLRVLTRLYVLW